MATATANESPYLTVLDLAVRWHTTKQGIYNARHRGKAPVGFRRGKNVLFHIEDVEKFEAAGRNGDPRSNPGLDPTRHAPEPRRLP